MLNDDESLKIFDKWVKIIITTFATFIVSLFVAVFIKIYTDITTTKKLRRLVPRITVNDPKRLESGYVFFLCKDGDQYSIYVQDSIAARIKFVEQAEASDTDFSIKKCPDTNADYWYQCDYKNNRVDVKVVNDIASTYLQESHSDYTARIVKCGKEDVYAFVHGLGLINIELLLLIAAKLHKTELF
jgi:hypothetical protein